MITGVTAVAPSGDGGPVRFTVATAASTQAASAEASSSAQTPAVAKPESSSAGSSTQNQQKRGGDPGDRNATGAYLASLLAASITGRAPEGARPSRITPERLSVLISYLEATVSSTRPKAPADDHAVDVKG